ncbi:MAG: PASTA domain-containing protein [Bacteroidales bacterium]
MSAWDFIFSKVFLRQLAFAAALSVVIIWGTLKMLDLYTLHGRTIEVPELQGYQKEEAAEILEAHNLRYVINDSIFNDTLNKGSVARLNPAPGTEVKRNRTIYLTTVAVLPEMVPMPDLVDLSRRQAITLLETHGLSVGQLEFQPDIARNAVLKQKYKDASIEPETLVEAGTPIDLVLGEGLGENIAIVPLVLGMTPEQAIRTLNNASLNVGEETYMDDEEDEVKVYLQEPNPVEEPKYLEAGSEVDLHYRSTAEFDFEEYMEQLLSVPVPDLRGLTPQQVEARLERLSLELGLETFDDGSTRDNARVYRQEPAYEEGMIIRKEETIDVWYRPADETDNEDL